jgi:hypothetical protein
MKRVRELDQRRNTLAAEIKRCRKLDKKMNDEQCRILNDVWPRTCMRANYDEMVEHALKHLPRVLAKIVGSYTDVDYPASANVAWNECQRARFSEHFLGVKSATPAHSKKFDGNCVPTFYEATFGREGPEWFFDFLEQAWGIDKNVYGRVLV